MNNNISLRVSETKLFKERNILGIKFGCETPTEAVFYTLDGEYILGESFLTGFIYVTDIKTGKVLDKSDRILNLFRLGI